MKQYRVIWADDEIENLATAQDVKDWKNGLGISIIAKAHTGKELRSVMASSIEMLDAVIVDANFDEDESTPRKESDISGLRCAFDLYRKYNEEQKRGILFFLYTGRSREFLFDKCEPADSKKINEIFEKPGRWFDKLRPDVLELMFEKIKQDVDEASTENFKLRNKYSDEFAAAELIENGPQWLLNALKFEYDLSVEYNDVEQYFNSARKIWEEISDGLKGHKLIPQISTINGVLIYLGGEKEVQFYKPLKRIIPPALCRMLDYFLDITQDGSHKNNDLTYKVIEYVRGHKNNNLHRSITYVVMELLLWYKQIIDNPPVDPLWETRFKAEGELKSITVRGQEKYYIVADRIYQIGNPDKKECKVGDVVIVLDSIKNYHMFETPYGMATEFVFQSQYEKKEA